MREIPSIKPPVPTPLPNSRCCCIRFRHHWNDYGPTIMRALHWQWSGRFSNNCVFGWARDRVCDCCREQVENLQGMPQDGSIRCACVSVWFIVPELSDRIEPEECTIRQFTFTSVHLSRCANATTRMWDCGAVWALWLSLHSTTANSQIVRRMQQSKTKQQPRRTAYQRFVCVPAC